MERQDNPTIAGDILLWRRIPPWADRVTLDKKGQPVPSSMNFRDKLDELSVFIASETSVERVLSGHDGFGVVEISAGEVRSLLGTDVVICHDPDPDPAHVIICGKVTRSQAATLAKRCRWVVKSKGLEGE